jgi:hypothetical protein
MIEQYSFAAKLREQDLFHFVIRLLIAIDFGRARGLG